MSKLLVYLDQNVLGLQLSARDETADGQGIQWVYSKEHFAEIMRSSDPTRHLDAIDKLGAKLLDLNLDQTWRITGTAQVVEHGSASSHFADYVESRAEVNCDDNIFDPLLAWTNGAQDDTLVSTLPFALARELQSLSEQAQLGLDAAAVDAVVRELEVGLGEMRQWGNDPAKMHRAFGLGRGEIGSITGGDELRKIWALIGPTAPGLTMERFFGFDPIDKQGYETWPLYLGITGCCAVLDIIGFNAERKRRKLASVPNVRSDAGHIGMAAFCSALLSADKRMIARAKAIYQYKEISTQCLLVHGAA